MSAAPGVFHLDHENTAVLVDPEAASDDQLLFAAEACPTGAITVLRDGQPVADSSQVSVRMGSAMDEAVRSAGSRDPRRPRPLSG